MFLALSTLLLAMASVQFGASLAKSLFPILGPTGTTTWRLVVAATILAFAWRPWTMRMTRTQWPIVLGYGVCLGCMNLFFYWAIARIPLGIAVALEFTGPLAVALLASRRVQDFVWAILTASGLALLFPWSPTSTLDPVGMFFALAAGACWAGYIIFGQKLGRVLHGGRGVALGMGVAALVALPVGVAQHGTDLWQPSVIWQAILVGLFSSAVPYSLEMIALKRLPPATFGILMSLEPALAALMGWIFLKEDLHFWEMMAIGLIIVASLGSTLAGLKKKPVAPPPL